MSLTDIDIARLQAMASGGPGGLAEAFQQEAADMARVVVSEQKPFDPLDQPLTTADLEGLYGKVDGVREQIMDIENEAKWRPDDLIVARITGATQVVAGQKWTYSWENVHKDDVGYGNWDDYTGGLTGTDNAYNLAEEQGEETNRVPDGSVVFLHQVITPDPEDDVEFWFYSGEGYFESYGEGETLLEGDYKGEMLYWDGTKWKILDRPDGGAPPATVHAVLVFDTTTNLPTWLESPANGVLVSDASSKLKFITASSDYEIVQRTSGGTIDFDDLVMH